MGKLDRLFPERVIGTRVVPAGLRRSPSMARIALITIVAPVLTIAWAGCGAPQIGADRDAFKAVDALYTAVSLRDPKLLDQCIGTLRDLKAKGKLPETAENSLESIVVGARAGEWESAQRRL